MQIITYITTAPRKVSTLEATVKSVRAAGFDPIVSFESVGQFGVVPAGTHYRLNSGLRGPWTHFLDCIADARDKGRGKFDAVAVFQDDVEVCRELWPWLETNMPMLSSIGVLSLWVPAILCRPTEPFHWWSLDRSLLPRKCMGALAVIMTYEGVCDLLSRPRYRNGQTRTDLWLGRWCKETNRDWWYPSTSLVEHTGGTSTLGDDANHVDSAYRKAGVWIQSVTQDMVVT